MPAALMASRMRSRKVCPRKRSNAFGRPMRSDFPPVRTIAALVRQGIDNRVHRNPIRIRRELVRILGYVHPLICIAQIGVVVDDNDESSLLVPDALAGGNESILLPRNMTGVDDVRDTGRLLQLVDFVELAEDRVIEWDIPDLGIGQYLPHLGFHIPPLKA